MSDRADAGTQTAKDGAGRNGRFAAGLLDPDIDTPDFVTPAGDRRADKRYAVYRNNVVVGLMEALRATYPSLHAIMGEENFARVGRNFLAAHPPGSAMMQRFGEGFDRFLAGFAPLRKSPFLADVARLERAWLEAYHASDAEVLQPEDIAGLAPESVMALVFEPHPALALVESAFPVADLFAYRAGRPQGGVDLSKPQRVMVTRPALTVEVTAIGQAQYVLLEALRFGKPLGLAAEEALARDGDFDLSAGLALCLEKGTFRRPVNAAP